MTTLPFDENLLAEAAEKGWLSLNKFAQLIGVSYPTAMRMMKRGDVTVIPFGGINRVNLDEIVRFLFKGNLTASSNTPRPEMPHIPSGILSGLPHAVRAKLADMRDEDEDNI